METSQITQQAHALYAAHGDKAEAEAAQKAQAAETEGDKSAAETWRAIRAAIRQMRGANAS